MSADLLQPRSQAEAALSSWENEGGTSEKQPAENRAAHQDSAQSTSTEMERLHIRMIAAENLLIALPAQDPHRPGQLARAMATFISLRPGFTPHARTLGAAAQMVHVVERAHHFQGWVEGESLT